MSLFLEEHVKLFWRSWSSKKKLEFYPIVEQCWIGSDMVNPQLAETSQTEQLISGLVLVNMLLFWQNFLKSKLKKALKERNLNLPCQVGSNQKKQTHQFWYILHGSFHLQTHNFKLNLALLIHWPFIVLWMLHKLEDWHLTWK